MPAARREGAAASPHAARPDPWLLVLGLLAVVRLVAVACHHTLPTPYGPRPFLEAGGADLFRRALVAELGSLALLALLLRLLAHALFALLGPRGEKLARVTAAALAAGYLFVGQIDLELMRWMGQHFSLEWLRAYSWAPDPLKMRLLKADLPLTALALGFALVPGAFLLARALRAAPAGKPSWRVTGLVCIAALLGLEVSLAEMEPRHLWHPIEPTAWVLFDEVKARVRGGTSAADLDEGIATLHEILNRPEGTFTTRGYPLWHEVKDEAAKLAAYRARPAGEKPDVLLLLIESPQGWEFDLRTEEARRNFPAVASLFAERGTYFPYGHSGGFPSPEGRVSVYLGLFAHPTSLTLTQYPALRQRSLPECLAMGGYTTLLVTAGDPDFDKMQAWYDQWFQRWVFANALADDVSAARKLVEIDRALPVDGPPRFSVWATVSMHAPQTFPGSDDDIHGSFHRRYMAAARYMNRALEELLAYYRTSPRWSRTFVVLAGDHSWPGPYAGFHPSRGGTPNAAETWVPIILAPPGGPAGLLREEPVSLTDVPQTILGAAGVPASNHFLGRDLLDPAQAAPKAVLSFRLDGIGVTRGEERLQLYGDDPGFVRKTRYTEWTPGCADVEPDGCYRGGPEVPLTDAERAELPRLRKMARAYGALFDQNRIMPPDAAPR